MLPTIENTGLFHYFDYHFDYLCKRQSLKPLILLGFQMELRGIEPLSEISSIKASPTTVSVSAEKLPFPPLHAH